jgi:hypothetical protein
MFMSTKISKSKSDLEFLYDRIDEIRMSSYERLRAKAALARADAFAEAAIGIINLFKRLLTAAAVRPVGHPTKLAR